MPRDRSLDVDAGARHRPLGGSPETLQIRRADFARLAAAPRSAVLQHDIHGQPVKPGGKQRVTSKGSQALPDTNEHILHQFGGTVRVARHAQT
jgi:hypothetical protein